MLQVVILSIFGLLSADFFYRAKRYHGRDGDGEVVMGKKSEQARVWRDRKFRIFVGAVSLAYLGILIRCVYRWVFLLFFLLLGICVVPHD